MPGQIQADATEVFSECVHLVTPTHLIATPTMDEHQRDAAMSSLSPCNLTAVAREKLRIGCNTVVKFHCVDLSKFRGANDTAVLKPGDVRVFVQPGTVAASGNGKLTALIGSVILNHGDGRACRAVSDSGRLRFSGHLNAVQMPASGRLRSLPGEKFRH